MYINELDEEQRRIVINLEQHYDVWIEAKRQEASLAYGYKWVPRDLAGGITQEYLYELLDRAGNAKSKGARSTETEELFRKHVEKKKEVSERLSGAAKSLAQSSGLYRSLRLPTISSEGAKILREADIRGMLGKSLLVIGTNAIPAYSLEAGGVIKDAPDRTDDFDMSWISTSEVGPEHAVLAMLKSVDRTYTVNTERTFQVRNSKAHEFELLAAPSTINSMFRQEIIKPIPLIQQEWLLMGRHVSHVVVAMDGSPARLEVPDPRYFALQKIWMSRQEDRNPLKRPKDLAQGIAVLGAVQEAMPQFPLDDEFEAALPEPLLEIFKEWAAKYRNEIPTNKW